MKHRRPTRLRTMERNHRTRPPDVEEALSSMLWTPYEQDEVVESPPYHRRNQIFAGDSKGPCAHPIAKLRTSNLSAVPATASSRFSFPFVSSIRTVSMSNGSPAVQDLPSYDEISGNKRLSMPAQPYVLPTAAYAESRVRGINQSFTDEFISSRLKQVR